MKATEIYKPPFTTDGVFIYAGNGAMCLMPSSIYGHPDKMLIRTCEVLNGDKPLGTANIGWDNGEVYVNGIPLLTVRGWGYLTGEGGLNLSQEEAERIQNEFIAWVADRLRGDI